MPTPGLVQHGPNTDSHNANMAGPVNSVDDATHPATFGVTVYSVNLPDLSLPNNCIISWFVHDHGVTVTSVTDNVGNTYASVLTTPPDAGVSQMVGEMYACFGCLAGAQKITHTFSARSGLFKCHVSEWYNIATSSATDGNVSSTTSNSPSPTTGSFTPATDGDMILSFFVNSTFVALGGTNPCSGFTAGASHIDLVNDRRDCFGSQYTIQAAHAAINPGCTITQSPISNTDTFIAAACAFKAASAGTPKPAGPYIIGTHHQYPALIAGVSTFDIPATGTFMAMTVSVSFTQCPISSITDSANNHWESAIDTVAHSDVPQIWYTRGPVVLNTTLIVTVNINIGSNKAMLTFYDMTGLDVNPFDGVATAVGALLNIGENVDTTHGSMIAAPAFRPNTNRNGITLACIGFGDGPCTGPITFGVFDNLIYAGKTDAGCDNGDGWAHYFHTSNALQNWGWTDDSPTLSSWGASAIAFKAALSGQASSKVPIQQRTMSSC